MRRWEIKWCNQSLWRSWNEVMTFKYISRDIAFVCSKAEWERALATVTVVALLCARERMESGTRWKLDWKDKTIIFFPRTSSTLSLCDQGRDCELWTFSLWHPHPKRVHPGGRLQVVPIFKDDNFWSGIGCTAWFQIPGNFLVCRDWIEKTVEQNGGWE